MGWINSWDRRYLHIVSSAFLSGALLFGLGSLALVLTSQETNPFFILFGILAGGWLIATIISSILLTTHFLTAKDLNVQKAAAFFWFFTYFAGFISGVVYTPICIIKILLRKNRMKQLD